jgi:uncharacterized protein DUF3291
MQLAQLNIAHWKYGPADPRNADFTRALDAVNTAADRSDGFVWRLIGDPNDPKITSALDQPGEIVNMSVWQSVDQLEEFVWKTIHKNIYRRKNEWFDAPKIAHFAMWTVPEGHVPDIKEGLARLAHLREQGNTDFAFDWAHLKHIKLWQSQRCG